MGGTLLGFVLLWLLLDRLAATLGSTRGEAGLLVLALVFAAAVACECVLSQQKPGAAASALGLRWPKRAALVWTLVLAAGLLAYFPVFAMATGARLELLPGAALLAIGMIAQGGLAEEVVFRGFVFRRFRVGRTFWRAALLASIPFIAVHTLLFREFEFAIALTSLLLAVSMSFPLAWLFERSGGSVLAPAILHGVVQAGIKVVDAGEHFPLLALGWIGLCAIAPWSLFLLLPSAPNRERMS
jgi:membrane protease YdiL (CAAX protease family)